MSHLIFNGTTSYALFNTADRNDASWRVEFRLAKDVSGSTDTRLLGVIDSYDSYLNVEVKNSTDQDYVRYRQNLQNVDLYNTGRFTNDYDFHDYVLGDDGSDMTLQIDGGVINVTGGAGGKAFEEYNVFGRAGAIYYQLKLEYFRYYDTSSGSDALIYDWDANKSDRTTGQPVLKDSASGNDAVGFGFATDGTAWSDLSGDPTPGPIDLDLSDTTNQPTADTLSIELITQLGITGTLRQPTADKLTASAINELVLFDNLSQPSADTVDLSTVTIVGLLDNARQPSADVINLSAIGELVFSDNTRQPTTDSVQIEQVSGLVLNDNSRQPTVDTLSIELYTELSFADTLVQVSADTITLTSKTLPQFGKNDIMMIDNSEDYQLTDNSIEYKAK